MTPRLYLLDGSALVYRAFFAMERTGLMSPATGEPTAAILGFANTLHAVIREDRPEYLAVVFDAPGRTFRHEAYEAYKATRSEMPDGLRAQIPRVKEFLSAWPCPILEVQGVEADDVIGSYAAQLAGPELHVVVVTGDKDFYQLLSPFVSLLDPGRGGAGKVETKVVGPDDIPDKFGVTEPSQVLDVLALMGDASDNVPGVPGVGPKTAARLIAAYGSVRGLYERLSEVAPPLREKLAAYREAVDQSRELVTIRTDLDLPLPLDALRRATPGGPALVRILGDLGFRRLQKELGLDEPEGSLTLFDHADTYPVVTDETGLRDLAGRLREASSGFALHAVISDSDPLRGTLLGIAVAPEAGRAYYVNMGHPGNALSLDLVREILGPVLADPGIPKIGHDAKGDLIALERAGLPVQGFVWDTLIAAYLLDPEGAHALADIARARYGEDLVTQAMLLGSGARRRAMDQVPAVEAVRYAAGNADVTRRLRDAQEPELQKAQLDRLFHDVEMPLLDVLRDMQRTGVALDAAFLAEMDVRLDTRIAELNVECHQLAGMEFNVHSPQQLAQILFETLQLPRGRRTKTGYSTDSEVLESLRALHPLPDRLLEVRLLSKLRSTYVSALPTLVHPATGRVHTTFNQTVAATGRLSSSDPNLQNIPIRTPLGREVRRAFVPGVPGWVLVSADYSQIELRIMAHVSQDPALLAAFREGGDVHRDTASRIFGVPADQVTDLQRGQAKTVNFGVLYGQGPYGLARTLGIPNEAAAAFIKAYRVQYAGVMSYLEGTLEKARRTGAVTTLMNRRRFLPQIRSGSPAARAAAERLAVNTPIQGSAADLLKVAMVNLSRRMKSEGLAGHLLLTVHDELVLESPREEASALAELVRTTMAEAIRLDVPVVVNVGIGANWAEIH